MITCTKKYFEIPFAHRQHLHDGRCSFIHGHNWDIFVTFACNELDENGFVVDLGKLKFLKEWISENLDHACVLATSDPLKEKLISSAPTVWKVYEVESCSCEGLAQHLLNVFDNLVRKKTDGRVWICKIEICEDKKNSASAYCKNT